MTTFIDTEMAKPDSSLTQNSTWTFQGAAWSYERTIAPILALWSDQLLEGARIAPGMSVLDVACGTGTVARRAAHRVGSAGRVVGTDLNPNMLEVAQVLAQQEQLPIEWHATPAESLPFAAAEFDVVTCQQGLQFFPDRPKALSEMARVLRPGGRLALAVWRPIAYQAGLARIVDIFSRYVGDDAVAGACAPFALGNASALRTLLADAGYEDIRVRIAVHETRTASLDEEIDTMADFLGDAWRALDASSQAACRADLAAELADYVDDDSYVTPMEAHLIVAEAG